MRLHSNQVTVSRGQLFLPLSGPWRPRLEIRRVEAAVAIVPEELERLWIGSSAFLWS